MPTIITVEELLAFCRTHNVTNFSSSEAGHRIAVSIPAFFEQTENENPDRRGLLTLKVKVCHTGLNRNGSYISEEAMKAAMPSLKNRPLMAHIHQLEDGTYDFGGHDVVVDEDGNMQYLETQIGNFTEDEPVLEHDDEQDKDYVVAYAVVSEEYTRAADIIREKGGSKNSCELYVDKFAYNAKDDYLELQEFYFNASTLLGKTNDGREIGEGMLGSHADIVFENLGNIQDFNINENLKEGGQQVEDNTLMENFDGEGEGTETPPATNPDTTENPETTDGDNKDDEEEGGEDEGEVSTDPTPKKKTNSFSVGDYNFELSYDDISWALYELVNNTYSEVDNTWYGVEAFEGYVIMKDWCFNRNYRQAYKVENDVVSLVGDRVQVYSVYVTEEERTALDEMRQNYESLVEFKAKAENEAARANKLNSVNDEKYAVIKNSKAYKDLVKNIDTYSAEDFEKEVKLVLFEYREAHPESYAHTVGISLNDKPVKKAFGTLIKD